MSYIIGWPNFLFLFVCLILDNTISNSVVWTQERRPSSTKRENGNHTHYMWLGFL
jgi:hypothetical protein